jgi:hypothetical protein
MNKTSASNKTQQLIKLIDGGTHRIDQYGYLSRWVASRAMWMHTDCGFRKDVIHRADMHFYRLAKAVVAA